MVSHDYRVIVFMPRRKKEKVEEGSEVVTVYDIYGIYMGVVHPNALWRCMKQSIPIQRTNERSTIRCILC